MSIHTNQSANEFFSKALKHGFGLYFLCLFFSPWCMEAMILREHHVFCEREIHQNPVSSGGVELRVPMPGGVIRGTATRW